MNKNNFKLEKRTLINKNRTELKEKISSSSNSLSTNKCKCRKYAICSYCLGNLS